MAEPHIIVWDVETVQNLVASFTLYERGGLHLPHQNVVQERYIVCAAWKQLGKHPVQSTAITDFPLWRKDRHNDLEVCRALHAMLSTADAIVAHNGDEYDIKFTEGRFLAHGLPPLPPMYKIDTLKVARNRFYLNSNRLDYLGAYLGLGRKIAIDQGVWLTILTGTRQEAANAVRTMLRYNKQDVRLLEQVFLRLRPYCSNYLNRQLFEPTGSVVCPRCGSTKLTPQQMRRTRTGTYRRYACRDCGGWTQARQAEKTPKPTLVTI